MQLAVGSCRVKVAANGVLAQALRKKFVLTSVPTQVTICDPFPTLYTPSSHSEQAVLYSNPCRFDDMALFHVL